MSKRFLLASTLLAIAFLLCVVIYQSVTGWFKGSLESPGGGLTNYQLLLAVAAESLRAVLTTWLYMHHRSGRSTLNQALLFGFICSLLIGSIWILLAIAYLPLTNPVAFAIDDSIILVMQGVASGYLLWRVSRD